MNWMCSWIWWKKKHLGYHLLEKMEVKQIERETDDVFQPLEVSNIGDSHNTSSRSIHQTLPQSIQPTQMLVGQPKD